MGFNNRPALAAAAGLAFLAVFVPSPPAASQARPTVVVMDWNIHHGVDTSGANNLDRVATWIARVNPHVVSLNEVEKQNGYNNNADEPAVLQSMLQQKTGATWYGCFAQREGAARGQGNLLLSRVRIDGCDRHLLTASRSVARAAISVNGVAIHVFSTHLDDGSAATRAAQVRQLTAWASLSPEPRILMGDFNASAKASELQPLGAAHEDAWPAASARGKAVSYPGNTAGNTRNGRIDYIWRSNRSTVLSLLSAQVYDTGAISDHRPVSATYAIGDAPFTLPAPKNMRIIKQRGGS